MDQEDFEQDSMFADLPVEPELDDLLEQIIEEQDDREEFEPTDEELFEDQGTFLPGLQLEPVEEGSDWGDVATDPVADIMAMKEALENRGFTPECRIINLADVPELNRVLEDAGLPLIEPVDWLPADIAVVSDGEEVHILDLREPEEPPEDLSPVTEEDAEAMVTGNLPPLSNPSADDVARVPMPVVPDRPLSADELSELAATALAQIEEQKRRQKKEKYIKRMTANADIRHPANLDDYTQERIIEGGCGVVDCPLCLGKTCRFCGFGCWDKSAPECEHDIKLRHLWDEDKEEYRRGLIAAELTELGVTNEQRRREMLDKIFDGEPALSSNDWCHKCNKQIKLGQLIVTTSKGKYHFECPNNGTQEQTTDNSGLAEAKQITLEDASEEIG
jgi:hypothetical protein